MNSKERIIRALELKEPDQIPTFELTIDKHVIKALAGTEEPFDIIDKLDLDAVVVKPDYKKEFISEKVYYDEWGIKRQITNETIAPTIESPAQNISEYKNIRFPDPHGSHRFQTLEKAIKRFGDRKAVILNIRDVFSDIRDLFGYENTLISMIRDPENFCGLLDLIIDYNLELARIACRDYGITILVTTDDIAYPSGLMFSPQMYFSMLAPRFEALIRGFKDLGCYCIKHCDGNILDVLEHWIESGIDALHPIDPSAGMELDHFKERYGRRICLCGNVDCMTTLYSGSLEDVENNVKNCIRKAAQNGGYILTSSNSIHSSVKPENYLKMIECLNKFGKYPINFDNL